MARLFLRDLSIGSLPALVAGVATLAVLPGCIVVLGNTSRSYESSYADGTTWPAKRIGIEMDRPGPALAAQLGVNPSESTLVTRVVASSPADRAGVKQFDVITGVDGADGSMKMLRQHVQAKDIGQTIRLRIVRGAQVTELDVAVEQVPWSGE